MCIKEILFPPLLFTLFTTHMTFAFALRTNQYFMLIINKLFHPMMIFLHVFTKRILILNLLKFLKWTKGNKVEINAFKKIKSFNFL